MPLSILKYVNDNVIHEKLCYDGYGKKVARAIRSQNLFRHITRQAESMGMVVNSAKTMLLCISDSRTYHAEAFIEDEEDTRIESGSSMKVLGINFSSRPDMLAHVSTLCRNFRGRIWMLRHLHQNGFTEEQLLSVYRSMILPVHDYCWNDKLSLSFALFFAIGLQLFKVLFLVYNLRKMNK